MSQKTILSILLCLTAIFALAKPLIPAPDPRESISYWRPHIIEPQDNAKVARAQQVYRQLLRAWDSQRVAPGLAVVESEAGPWAAALADGYILLSRAALEICFKLNDKHTDDLLAFVMAHELAHQRANDLWHFKFLRLAGNQAQSVRQQFLAGIELDSKALSDLERREAQADHSGIILMATAGFDPYQIFAGKDFFSAWVESLWNQSCADSNRQAKQACRQAKTRALRSQAQMQELADQAVLFDLGTQAFAAGHNSLARRYFAAFGRDYPSRAVYYNLGLTHLAEAVEIQDELVREGADKSPAYIYPISLDNDLRPLRTRDVTEVRGVDQLLVKEKKQQKKHHIDNAITHFDRAIGLNPKHKLSLLMKATAYVLSENPYMTRGVLQGQYFKQFGQDAAAMMLLAMIEGASNHRLEAKKVFTTLMKQINSAKPTQSPLDRGLVEYAIAHNYAALLTYWGKPNKARIILKEYLQRTKLRGDGYLFQLVLQNLQQKKTSVVTGNNHSLVKGRRLGDRAGKNTAKTTDLWFEGERYQVFRFKDGATWITDANRILISAWQGENRLNSLQGLRIGDKQDRPLKMLGLPSRNLQLASGRYMVYDSHGLGFHIQNGEITRWFLYQTPR